MNDQLARILMKIRTGDPSAAEDYGSLYHLEPEEAIEDVETVRIIYKLEQKQEENTDENLPDQTQS